MEKTEKVKGIYSHHAVSKIKFPNSSYKEFLNLDFITDLEI